MNHTTLLTDGFGREIPSGQGPFTKMAEVKQANADLGHFWFDEPTMSFFGTRLYDTLYAGRFFVASHQPPNGPRVYAVHVAFDDGQVTTMGDVTLSEATTMREVAVALAEAYADQVLVVPS